MEIEKAKRETLTDSANMYSSKSKCQFSWVNNTKSTGVKVSVLGIWIPRDNNHIKGANQDNVFVKKKKLIFIESYLSSHK